MGCCRQSHPRHLTPQHLSLSNAGKLWWVLIYSSPVAYNLGSQPWSCHFKRLWLTFLRILKLRPGVDRGVVEGSPIPIAVASKVTTNLTFYVSSIISCRIPEYLEKVDGRLTFGFLFNPSSTWLPSVSYTTSSDFQRPGSPSLGLALHRAEDRLCFGDLSKVIPIMEMAWPGYLAFPQLWELCDTLICHYNANKFLGWICKYVKEAATRVSLSMFMR